MNLRSAADRTSEGGPHFSPTENDYPPQNNGPCGFTSSNRPWSQVVSMEFPTERAARVFERYLKSGSGRAFAKRHFAPIDA